MAFSAFPLFSRALYLAWIWAKKMHYI